MQLKSITLNLSGRCNFRCIACPQSYHLGHYDNMSQKTQQFSKLKKGFISKHTIKRFFKSLEEYTADSCSLDWNGETMMHPKFIELYETLCKNNLDKKYIKNWVLDTNASFLNPQLSKKIIEITNKYNQSLTLTFSLDAIKQSSFTKIKRTNVSIKKIYLNCKEFILLRGNSERITILIKSLVFKENLNEMFEFYVYWKQFFESNSKNYKVIFSDGDRKQGINNYIFFSKISPESIGNKIWAEFKPTKDKIRSFEK